MSPFRFPQFDFKQGGRHNAQAERERRVAAFCSLLLVDHFLDHIPGGEDTGPYGLDRFKKLIDVFGREAGPLVAEPAEFKLPDGEPLLDDRRLEYLRELDNPGTRSCRDDCKVKPLFPYTLAGLS